MLCVKIEPLILGAFKSELLKAIFFEIFVVNGLKKFFPGDHNFIVRHNVNSIKYY